MDSKSLSVQGASGMAVAPHSAAAEAAASVMREGGNAVEAMIAAAATIAVVYPHMNGIGGDGFWLIAVPGKEPICIEGCGAAAINTSVDVYRDRGFSAIPFRGPLAANTVAGTVSGWAAAYEWSQKHIGGSMPISRLLDDAIHYARNGIDVTNSQANCIHKKRVELASVSGFHDTFLVDNLAATAGSSFKQPRLANTLEHLARFGLNDFYCGALAESIANDFKKIDGFITIGDLNAHAAKFVRPLALKHSKGTVFNLPPPTQGLVSLLILGQLDRLPLDEMRHDSAEFVHACVEATKNAFKIRDACITDPIYMKAEAQSFLTTNELDYLTQQICLERAAPWGAGKGPGDTVWLGAIDKSGISVSFIQSIYHEFGSGVVLNGSGINWQNRGASFSLKEGSLNRLEPGRKPFHTLNPALARLEDGRTIVYGNMGGDGQPQTQSAVFSRLTNFSMTPSNAIDAPRWLLGRTWGNVSESLKLEARFSPQVVEKLRALGHEVEILSDYDEAMGHAGAITRFSDGRMEGSSDRRSDGAAIIVDPV